MQIRPFPELTRTTDPATFLVGNAGFSCRDPSTKVLTSGQGPHQVAMKEWADAWGAKLSEPSLSADVASIVTTALATPRDEMNTASYGRYMSFSKSSGVGWTPYEDATQWAVACLVVLWLLGCVLVVLRGRHPVETNMTLLRIWCFVRRV